MTSILDTHFLMDVPRVGGGSEVFHRNAFFQEDCINFFKSFVYESLVFQIDSIYTEFQNPDPPSDTPMPSLNPSQKRK